MIRREIICDLCGEAIPKGKPVMGFEFASGPKVNGETFDFTFSDYGRVERHWCGPCLVGVAKMVPEARSKLKTIAGM